MFHATQIQSRTQTYILDELIDKTSAYSIVYKAHPQHSQEVVVIKISKEQRSGVWNEAVDEGFDNERSLLEKLIHPNIIKLHDAGEDYGRKFLVLEYGGQSLRKLQEAHQPPFEADGTLALHHTVQIALPVLFAIDYVHKQGIAHKDIDDRNIVFQHNTAKLIDFNHRSGIASPQEQQQDIRDIGLVIHDLLTNKNTYDLREVAPTFSRLYDERLHIFRTNYTANELAKTLKQLVRLCRKLR